MTELTPGSVVDGRYEIVSCLGEGGMGVVYEAVHKDLQRVVALKMLKASLATQPEKLARFRNEAQVISALSHPNIVSVYAIGVSDRGIPYIAMELLKGTSLAEQIREHGCLSYRVALPLFIQICDALSHAHAKAIIHRDLKPSNFVVEGAPGESRIKVVDFGIAKMLDVEQGLTRTSAFVGSVFYMSPGLCEGRAPDVRSDIYAIGCSLYEALTGKPPFAADSYVHTLEQHRSAVVPPLVEAMPGLECPADLDQLIRCCLEKDPDDRYATVQDLRRDLENVLLNRPLQHVPRRVRDTTSSRRVLAWQKIVVPLALFGVVAAAAAIGYSLMVTSADEKDRGLARTEANRLYNNAWSLINDHQDGDANNTDFSNSDKVLEQADAVAASLYDPYLSGLSDWCHALTDSLKSDYFKKEDTRRGPIRRRANHHFTQSYQNFDLARERAAREGNRLQLDAINHYQTAMLLDEFDFLKHGGNANRYPHQLRKLFNVLEMSSYRPSAREKDKIDELFAAAFEEELFGRDQREKEPEVRRAELLELASRRVKTNRRLGVDERAVSAEIDKMASSASKVNKSWAREIIALKEP